MEMGQSSFFVVSRRFCIQNFVLTSLPEQSVSTNHMTKQEYFNHARLLWQTYVPRSGQSEYVQGELIRVLEKLRDEAERNGNKNWDRRHEAMVAFLKRTLQDSNVFAKGQLAEIDADLERVLDYEHPDTSGEPFDRLSDRIVDWYLQNKEPIPHEFNPELELGAVRETRKPVLHAAVRDRDAARIRTALKTGADIEEKNEFGGTPLFSAAAYGYIDIIEVLLENGANINAVDRIGQSVLDMAIYKKDAAKFLAEHGALSAKKGELNL